MNNNYNIVQVPRNILLATTDFDYFEWSVIIVLLTRVHEWLTFSITDILNTVLPEIVLPFAEVSATHHNRDLIYDKLLALRRKDIRYRVPINGYAVTVTTGLFSSIRKIEGGGGVFAIVSRDAVPWLLSLGRGYACLEKKVFDACRSIYVRRLYLLILSRASNQSVCCTLPIDTIRTEIGCHERETPTLILRRYFGGLEKIIENEAIGSDYTFSYSPIYDKTSNGVGRKSISSVSITFCRTDNNNDYGRVLTILNRYYQVLKDIDRRNLADVVNEICNNKNATALLLHEHKRYIQKYEGDIRHVANTMTKVLLDRVNIDTAKKIQKGKNNEIS